MDESFQLGGPLSYGLYSDSFNFTVGRFHCFQELYFRSVFQNDWLLRGEAIKSFSMNFCEVLCIDVDLLAEAIFLRSSSWISREERCFNVGITRFVVHYLN